MLAVDSSINFVQRVKVARQSILIFVGIFISFLLFSSIYRSSDRRSLLGGEALFGGKISDSFYSKSSVEGNSELHLQDFVRSEVRNGKLSWHIIAKEAKYFADERLAQLQQAEITIYRDEGSSVGITADAGKIYVNGDALSRTELEGNVEIILDSSVIVETDRATFDNKERLVNIPGAATITGAGFWVSGVGMQLEVDSKLLNIFADVSSRFESGSSIPNSIKKVVE